MALTTYGQINPAWGAQLLGFGPDTIATAGCYLTTDAMIMTWLAQGASGTPLGAVINPSQLNALYKANGIYVAGDLLPDSALHLAFPNLIELVSTYTPPGAADLSTCDTSGVDYVLLFIRYPHGLTSDNPHFVPVWNYKAGAAPGTLLIADAWDGVIKPLSHYGDPATIICKVLHLRPLAQPPAKFTVGQRIQVASGPLNVRSSPALAGTLLGTQALNALGMVSAGPSAADSHNWYQVNYDAAPSGWSADDFLVPAPLAPPQPSPRPLPPLRAMFDSTNIDDIPTDAPIVVRYVDGSSAIDEATVRARFPHALIQGISAVGTDAGEWLDVETGDATPDFAPGWVAKRRAAGVDAGVYMNAATWAAVRQAFQAVGMSEPPYWVASWAAGAPPPIPAGAIALQYANPTFTLAHYDLSQVAVSFPPPPLAPPTPPHAALVATPSSGPVPLTVSLDGSGSKPGSNPIASYGWDFGHQGQTGSAPILTYTFLSAGTQSVKLTVTDSKGLSESASATITVDPVSPPKPPPDLWPWLQALLDWLKKFFGG